MESLRKPTVIPEGPDVSHLKVPPDLLSRMHDATARFHSKRKYLEEMTSNSEYRHQGRIDEANADLQTTEKELEELTRQIEEIVHRPA